MRMIFTATLIAAMFPVATQAQTPPAVHTPTVECPTMTAAPANFAGWEKPAPMTVATGDGNVTALPLKSAVQLDLVKQAGVAYRAAPPAGADGFGGVLTIDIAAAGTYQVATSADAWVNLVGGAGAVASNGEMHGPNCTSITKIIGFPLKPGRYLLELSGVRAATIAVMVAPAG